MKMILKGCQRCGGDLMPDLWDLDGKDMCCVQCGRGACPAVLRSAMVPQAGLRALSPSYASAGVQSKVA